jgi:hypothetical protein
MVKDITGDKPGGGYIDLQPKNFSWISGVAKAFERIVWHECHIYWKPAVGTTTNGIIAYGADWGSNDSSVDKKTVQACTPVYDHPVWQDTRSRPMVLPRNRLQSRKEYILSGKDASDVQPGRIAYYCSASGLTSCGELWVRYRVSFYGTQA